MSLAHIEQSLLAAPGTISSVLSTPSVCRQAASLFLYIRLFFALSQDLNAVRMWPNRISPTSRIRVDGLPKRG